MHVCLEGALKRWKKTNGLFFKIYSCRLQWLLLQIEFWSRHVCVRVCVCVCSLYAATPLSLHCSNLVWRTTPTSWRLLDKFCSGTPTPSFRGSQREGLEVREAQTVHLCENFIKHKLEGIPERGNGLGQITPQTSSKCPAAGPSTRGVLQAWSKGLLSWNLAGRWQPT